MYEGHGWRVQQVLLRPETSQQIESSARASFADAELRDSDFDAVWFARPSHGQREAWELRLVAEQPYALFEAFEADDDKEDREAMRREMENRMREHATQ